MLAASGISIAREGQQLDFNGPQFSFQFESGVPVERCFIDAMQSTGGGMGRSTSRPRASGSQIVVRTSIDRGLPPRALKAAMWCPGFGMALVDVPSLEQANFQTTVKLTPRPDVVLAGRVLPPADSVSLANATLRAYYEADWLCGYFEQTDCGVPQWEVTTGRVAADGSFRVMVPDFAGDPVVGTGGRHAGAWRAGAFWFRADRSQAPFHYRLTPDGDPCWAGRIEQPGSLPIMPCGAGTLPVAAEYRELILRAKAW
jgi:hypothetical protein